MYSSVFLSIIFCFYIKFFQENTNNQNHIYNDETTENETEELSANEDSTDEDMMTPLRRVT